MDTVSKSWQKNLYALVLGESLVLIGFNFVGPFLPLFIQELGSFSDREAALWAGIATGGAGLAAFLSGPVWGIIADRWGRKLMLLRAQFAGAVIVALVALSPNVYYLVGLRTLQGMMAGTVAAASALVAAMTPRDRMPFAMGVLMVAYYGGSTIGPMLGGAIADSVGFRGAFFITAGLLLVGGLIVLFFVEEEFDRTRPRQRASLGSLWQLAISREILPLLVVMCALQAGTQVLAPVIPLFVRTLEPAGKAATASGVAFGLMGILAGLSALVAGRIGARVSLKRILVFSCLGTALLHLPPVLAGTVPQLIIFVVLTGLLKGGLLASSNALVGLSVSADRQGVAYGLAQSANALGGAVGPLMGGGLASLLGFKSIFPITAMLFVLTAILVMKLLGERPPIGADSEVASS